MKQTHLAPIQLKGIEKPEKDMQVLFAVKPNRKAILFIHGFSGDAIKTWSDFHEFLPSISKSIGSDIFFYGYDGLWAEMNASASIFRGFLDRLFGTTKVFLADNLPPSAQRIDDFEYDELVIVAHSLGAVISRRALLDATRNKSDWVTKTKLILYAPAHKGAKVVDLMLSACPIPFLSRFVEIPVRFYSPLIDELKPDSRTLKKLLEDTEIATKNGENQHLVASKVVIAEYEKIVENETFGDDPPAEAISGANHMSVCKPKKDFLKPLTILEACL